jgi:hypothetical protein
MHVISYMNVNLGLTLPCVGARPDSFGHYILTNIGSFGIQQGFAPLVPPMRVVGITCAGAIR